MGWTYCEHNGVDTVAFIRNQFTSSEFFEKYNGYVSRDIVDLTKIGNTIYTVVKYTTPVDVQYYGMVVLVSREKNEIGFKNIDESCGPYYYDMPIRMLDFLDKHAPTQYESTVGWRKKCREHHAQRKVQNAARKQLKEHLKSGTRIMLYGKEYVINRQLDGRKGWEAYRDEILYRIPLKMLDKATLVTEETAGS